MKIQFKENQSLDPALEEAYKVITNNNGYLLLYETGTIYVKWFDGSHYREYDLGNEEYFHQIDKLISRFDCYCANNRWRAYWNERDTREEMINDMDIYRLNHIPF